MDANIQKMGEYENPEWGKELLKSIALFQAFTDIELTSLYEQGELIVVNALSHIVIEGEPTRGLYVILKGSVSVYKNGDSKNSMIRLTHLESGGYFGEISLFDDSPRSATVVAETTCELFKLDSKNFEQFLNLGTENLRSRFYKRCAEEMAARFRNQNNDYITTQTLLWKYALEKKIPS